ncbi:molybdate ABC transporter substrate-binding protein [Nesterenkonia sp. DZ6]|uniref:molybdate ABC transporter substrate-binding protein n=1 Tax=Nesterenkonia sp. DZ6 TaxID=2901229 RepID=UPI001F4D1D10|nr:molybdate ABC transporter substrate-binding protein [Nesterenkonia sp. DZ6]MCH8560036.1 molybdate ABC transporter substrate-binding protein [Nesterenkonia sp. DZ6]
MSGRGPSGRRPRRLRVGAGVGVMLAVTGCATPGSGSSGPETDQGAADVRVQVAAAADLKYALDEVIDEFAVDHPEVEVAVTYGSSGNFAAQIRNGAPFDVYLSADIELAQDLAEDGFGDPDSVFDYAVGRLVVWAPQDSPADVEAGIDGLVAEEVRTVAIANPEHAPYGEAAQAAIQTAGATEELQSKLVLGENIAQAAEFVLSGNADAGIVALSLALSPPMTGAGSHVEVPLDSFPTLRQGGMLLDDATVQDEDFVAFIGSEEGQAILVDYGFYPPSGED